MKVNSISSAPTDYSSWMEYLDGFDKGIPDENFERLLSNGACPEYGGVKIYFHNRLEKAVNSIIGFCINDLRRNILEYIEDNELSGIHIAFIRFSKRIKKCMFFEHIPFLDTDYKNELSTEIKKEVGLFWRNTLKSLNNDVKQSNNRVLEEELFLIGRIKLFC